MWLQAHPRPADGPDRPAAQYFTGVSEAAWDYTVGGHHVLCKWLRARQGRTLKVDELGHFRRMVAAIEETLRLQAGIDVLALNLLGPRPHEQT